MGQMNIRYIGVMLKGMTLHPFARRNQVEGTGLIQIIFISLRGLRAQELCESRGGRPGLPSLISLMVSVDVKQQ